MICEKIYFTSSNQIFIYLNTPFIKKIMLEKNRKDREKKFYSILWIKFKFTTNGCFTYVSQRGVNTLIIPCFALIIMQTFRLHSNLWIYVEYHL